MITHKKMQPEKGLARLHARGWENDTIIFFLSDLSPDSGETRNLAKADPEIVRQLEELRVRWDTELMAPTFPGRQRPGAQTEANPSTQP